MSIFSPERNSAIAPLNSFDSAADFKYMYVLDQTSIANVTGLGLLVVSDSATVPTMYTCCKS